MQTATLLFRYRITFNLRPGSRFPVMGPVEVEAPDESGAIAAAARLTGTGGRRTVRGGGVRSMASTPDLGRYHFKVERLDD